MGIYAIKVCILCVFYLFISFVPSFTYGACTPSSRVTTPQTWTAASASYSDVKACYDLSGDGDTISVPSGDQTWNSTLTIDIPNLKLIGAGIDSTILRLGSVVTMIRVNYGADNIRISGFTFDGNSKQNPMIYFIGQGTEACYDTTIHMDGFRIDHNKFIEGGVYSTDYAAIRTRGRAYGLIDNNIFNDQLGECIDLCGDGALAKDRITNFGMYTEGVVYIEDNTWNTTQQAENVLDCNDGAAWVFRKNTINITGSGYYGKILELHEFCVNCSCGNDRLYGPIRAEVYDNVVNASAGGNAQSLVKIRGGSVLVYNNTRNGGSYEFVVEMQNYRSFHYGCSNVNSSGYSRWCHENDGSGGITEGRLYSKTTLTEALDASETEIDVASVDSFPTYGGSIIVGSEQIDYTGISGSTITGCTRGANGTSATTHSNGSSVDLLLYGICVGQVNNTYIWGNSPNLVRAGTDGGYSAYDIKSYAERPSNWQYRNDGTEYSYTPYTYPHPLRGEGTGCTISGANASGATIK